MSGFIFILAVCIQGFPAAFFCFQVFYLVQSPNVQKILAFQTDLLSGNEESVPHFDPPEYQQTAPTNYSVGDSLETEVTENPQNRSEVINNHYPL